MTQEQNPVEELQSEQMEIDSAAQGNESRSSENDSVEALLAQIESLQDELTQSKEQSLRIQAEMQNVRRRAQQDVEKAHKFSIEKLVNDILPVADNLERALSAASDKNADAAAVIEGVELTLKSLIDALKRHQVERVDPEGEPFDPQLHQAMSVVENGDVEPNTVLTVYQRGYTLNGRLVRPAMVVVSKAK